MYKIKYFLEYSDTEGIISRLEILEKDFDGDETKINGNVTLNYAERKDLLQYSAPSSLDINLESGENLTLQDLYSESENQFHTKFIVDGQVLFYGILKPDGVWEDWVNDKWEMSIDAMDGLSILKDLSFVKDDGTFYLAKITQFVALKQCLHRIGYDLPINISNDIPTYDGFSSSDSILHNVQMNADRFYQDAEKNNIMDCEEVLKSILEPYNATIFQMNGEWWIVRSLDFKPVMNFKKYNGAVKTDVVWDSQYFIGSHIDGFEIHHINANQKKSVNASSQAFRVNYKYGSVQNVLENPYLYFNNDYTSDGWITDNDPSYIYVGADNNGIGINVDEDLIVDLSTFYWNLLTLDQAVSVKLGQDINIQLNFISSLLNSNDRCDINFYLSTPNYIFQNGEWKPKPGTSGLYSHSVNIGNGDGLISVSFGDSPETGLMSLKIGVYLSFSGVGTLADFNILFKSILLNQGNSKTYKGEFHTAQRSSRISSVTKSDKSITVGDSISDFYYGTIYKYDGSPTELWNRLGLTDNKGLLRIMVEDTLRISPRPMLYFEGDIYGYIPYMALIRINNISGKYQISKYSYDTASKINKTSFKEFSTDLLDDSDFRYEFEYDYGNETKVTIVS